MVIGLLQQTITWYKIGHTGGQANYYSHTGTSKQRQVKLHCFRPLCKCLSAGIIMSLPSSMADFAPCDRLLEIKALFIQDILECNSEFHIKKEQQLCQVHTSIA